MAAIPLTEPRPDFLLIGAQKAGTTSLFFDLRAQPGVFIPDEKELCVLLEPAGDKVRAAYDGYFKAAATGDCRGDCSTDYTKRTEHQEVAKRAFERLGPDLKLIYVVRDPIQRLLSHHHHRSNEVGGISLERAIDEWPEIVDNSRYGFQLEAWLEYFPATAIHVVLSLIHI